MAAILSSGCCSFALRIHVALTVLLRQFRNTGDAQGATPLGVRTDVFNAHMLIGYMRVSTADQSTDLQRDALIAAGVADRDVYMDKASGKKDDRPGLDACLKALRPGDTLVVWKLDRLAGGSGTWWQPCKNWRNGKWRSRC